MERASNRPNEAGLWYLDENTWAQVTPFTDGLACEAWKLGYSVALGKKSIDCLPTGAWQKLVPATTNEQAREVFRIRLLQEFPFTPEKHHRLASEIAAELFAGVQTRNAEQARVEFIRRVNSLPDGPGANVATLATIAAECFAGVGEEPDDDEPLNMPEPKIVARYQCVTPEELEGMKETIKRLEPMGEVVRRTISRRVTPTLPQGDENGKAE